MNMKMWAVRLIAFLIVFILCIFAFRAFLNGALGCAGMIDRATYEDGDERSQTPVDVPFETMPPLDDSAYDRVFPDLVEPLP